MIQSSRQATEVLTAYEAEIWAHTDNSNPGVPTQMDARQWDVNARDQKKGANLLLLLKKKLERPQNKFTFLQGEKA